MITVKVPGKIHIMGEHAVVYGKPALLTTVDKYCTVQILPAFDSKITITSKNLNKTISLSPEMVMEKTVQKSAGTNDTPLGEHFFLEPDAALLPAKKLPPNSVCSVLSILETDMEYPVIAIGETLLYFKKKLISGFQLIIDSDIPIGSGLGSSAALAVAIVAAMTEFLEEKVEKSIINEIAFKVEQRKHGNPSGGDNGVVCYGGLVWFEKKNGIKRLDFTISESLANHFMIIDTGRPVESTGEMVCAVKDLYQKQPELVENFLSSQEKITNRLVTAIKKDNGKEIMSLIRTGEKNLETLGVVSKSTQEIIREIEKIGGAAKISGAGGREMDSGMVLAYHNNRKKLDDLLQSLALDYFNIQLGVEGLRIC